MRLPILLAVLLLLSACSEIQLGSHIAKRYGGSQSQGLFKVGNPYDVEGKTYYPSESYDLVETGIASWYGPGFHGARTANGEVFDTNELTGAHRTLQMPSLVRVTNLENGRSLIVRINDRGPYKRGRIIDVSSKAADLLGFKGRGTAKVKLEVLSKESRAIAEAAKRGMDTSGVEVALNRGEAYPGAAATASQPATYQVASATGGPPPGQGASVAPVESESLSQSGVPGHISQGRFMPDPVVTQFPVRPSNIYVQAGAFSVQQNAVQHAAKLGGKVVPAMVNGRQFFRVRLGPYATVDQADAALNRLIAENNSQAIIVVD